MPDSSEESGGNTTARCLVVQDDIAMANLIQSALEQNGLDVSVENSGEAALTQDQQYDIIILDDALPGIDGHETAQRLRQDADPYILMLTDQSHGVDKVLAVSAVADDYVTKPVSITELTERVQAVSRRRIPTESETGRRLKRIDGLVVDGTLRTATLHGTPLPLTRLEFDLLQTLSATAPAPVTRNDLIVSGWGDSNAATPHILHVHVHNLRRKLAEVKEGGVVIESVRGVGFALVESSD